MPSSAGCNTTPRKRTSQTECKCRSSRSKRRHLMRNESSSLGTSRASCRIRVWNPLPKVPFSRSSNPKGNDCKIKICFWRKTETGVSASRSDRYTDAPLAVTMRRQTDKSGQLSQSMMDCTASEQFDEIRRLPMNNISLLWVPQQNGDIARSNCDELGSW